jgi:hypothetical protein
MMFLLIYIHISWSYTNIGLGQEILWQNHEDFFIASSFSFLYIHTRAFFRGILRLENQIQVGHGANFQEICSVSINGLTEDRQDTISAEISYRPNAGVGDKCTSSLMKS